MLSIIVWLPKCVNMFRSADGVGKFIAIITQMIDMVGIDGEIWWNWKHHVSWYLIQID